MQIFKKIDRKKPSFFLLKICCILFVPPCTAYRAQLPFSTYITADCNVRRSVSGSHDLTLKRKKKETTKCVTGAAGITYNNDKNGQLEVTTVKWTNLEYDICMYACPQQKKWKEKKMSFVFTFLYTFTECLKDSDLKND